VFGRVGRRSGGERGGGRVGGGEEHRGGGVRRGGELGVQSVHATPLGRGQAVAERGESEHVVADAADHVLRLPGPATLDGRTRVQCMKPAQSNQLDRLRRRLWRELRLHNSPLHHSGVWRYRAALPFLSDPAHVVTLREGNTPLLSAPRAAEYAGLDSLTFKHQGFNPTGSFKDNGMTCGVSQAVRLGKKRVACVSTGNTSASLASYAAQAGMRGIVFLPAGNVAGGKLAQTLAYGATTVQIEGDFDDAMRLVESVCNELGIYLLNSLNPFRVEGQKGIGFELLQQLDWQAPDWLVLPAGNLGNTSAIGKAFRQAYQLGLISHMPRIASIQAEGANPFYRSFTGKFAERFSVHAETVATAIKIGNPVSYTRARRVIEESDGIVESVSDAEILAAKAVIDRSGIGCEPASAASLAGARKLVERGVIKHDERVVGVLTGTLLKDSKTGMPQGGSGIVVKPTIEAVRSVLTQ